MGREQKVFHLVPIIYTEVYFWLPQSCNVYATLVIFMGKVCVDSLYDITGNLDWTAINVHQRYIEVAPVRGLHQYSHVGNGPNLMELGYITIYLSLCSNVPIP